MWEIKIWWYVYPPLKHHDAVVHLPVFFRLTTIAAIVHVLLHVLCLIVRDPRAPMRQEQPTVPVVRPLVVLVIVRVVQSKRRRMAHLPLALRLEPRHHLVLHRQRRVLLAQGYAEETGLAIGDTVPLTVNGVDRELEVVGIHEDNPLLGFPLVTTPTALKRLGFPEQDNFLILEVADPGDATYAALEEAVADQQEFAELHAKFWPEVTVISTLRQISTGPEAPGD